MNKTDKNFDSHLLSDDESTSSSFCQKYPSLSQLKSTSSPPQWRSKLAVAKADGRRTNGKAMVKTYLISIIYKTEYQ